MDTTGKPQHASHETIASILELWGIAARTSAQIREAIIEYDLNYWQRTLDPVITMSAENSLDPGKRLDMTSFRIVLRLLGKHENHVANCALCLENGHTSTFAARLSDLRTLKRVLFSGSAFVAKQLSLPLLPPGYHRLDIEIAGRTASALIISAPIKSYSAPAMRKSSGVFLPMYAAHSSESWGAGNLGDWRKLSEWVASLGGRVVSTLPLLRFSRSSHLRTEPLLARKPLILE